MTEVKFKQAYCSWCARLTKHWLVEHNLISRDRYVCEGNDCGMRTVVCRVPDCSNMARGSEKGQSDFFCSEHDGSVADFSRLDYRVAYLDECVSEAKAPSKKINFQRGGSQAVCTLAGFGISSLAKPVVGPALARALGRAGKHFGMELLKAPSTATAISKLRGAAFTNASIAAIGDGAVAADGEEFAAGVVVISASGEALGRSLGGAITSQHLGSIPDLRIERLRQGRRSIFGLFRKPAIVLCPGFLTQDDTLDKWLPFIDGRWAGHRIYRLHWLSEKAQGDLGLIADAISRSTFAPDTELRSKFDGALRDSAVSGVILADFICRTKKESEFILLGHSLGCRVIFYALRALATRNSRPRVQSAWMFGGPPDLGPSTWMPMKLSCSHYLVNVFSREDQILKYLYPLDTLGEQPTETGVVPPPVEKFRQIDLTPCVGSSHSRYLECIGSRFTA